MKIPVSIHPFFWLLAAVIGWLSSGSAMGTLIWVVVILFSVLIHEYGHALTAIAFGQRAYIHLGGFGGVTKRSGNKLPLWKEFIIVLNGPIAGLLLFLCAYLLLNALPEMPNSPIIYFLYVTIWINLFWTAVNLLPMHPLDGGRLVSIILEAIFGLRGVKFALFISILLCVGVGLLFFGLRSPLPGALFMILAFENYRTWKTMMDVSEQDQDYGLWEELQRAEQLVQKGDLDQATQIITQVRQVAPSGMINVQAAQLMSDIYIKQGNITDAFRALIPVKSKLAPKYLEALHTYAYESGNYQEAVAVGDQLFELHPNYKSAVLNAFCHARLGQVRPTIGWLQSAIRQGLPNPRAVITKEDFQEIRQDPQFRDFVSTL
ncbi:MAG: site-2 protease family protein [Chlamydiales bacterium]|nr:site-2 protease family protein [Chlamydiia bacterium]MCP5507062.1 site-2 protease family protein [Chlamydiales bacterium]